MVEKDVFCTLLLRSVDQNLLNVFTYVDVLCFRGKKQIYDQIQERLEEKQIQDEIKEHEKHQIHENQLKMNLEDLQVHSWGGDFIDL